MVNVNGKWALITGASRGIGYLTAKFMAKQGCNLILHARTLEFDHPFTHEHLKFEVSEPEQWVEYVKKGDLHPAKTVWETGFTEQKKQKHHSEKIDFGERRLTRKDKAHMNFIESGKKYK